MVLCCLIEWWIEWTDSHTQTKKEDSTQACLCGMLCVGVVWTVCVSVGVGRRVVTWWIEREKRDKVKDTVTQKQKDALFPQTTFPLLFSYPNSFLS